MTRRRPPGAARKVGKRAPDKRRAPAARRGTGTGAHAADAQEIDAIRDQIARLGTADPPRWNANPEDARRSVLKLVLTLVELIRQLLERQAIRRMERGTLNAEDTESVGLALMRLEETIAELARQFDIAPEELTLDLGPVGRLL